MALDSEAEGCSVTDPKEEKRTDDNERFGDRGLSFKVYDEDGNVVVPGVDNEEEDQSDAE